MLEQPEVLAALCREIAENFKGQGVEFVAGPTTGGIIIAFEVARQMGLQSVYIESENSEKTLRRGKTLSEGANVLIVDDVLTTGRSLFESRDAILKAGGNPIGYGVLINRAQVNSTCQTYSVRTPSKQQVTLPTKSRLARRDSNDKAWHTKIVRL